MPKVLDDDGLSYLVGDIKTLADATYPSKEAIASDYDAESSYEIGDYCLKDGLLYKCNTAIGSGGEAWTSAHWTQVNVGDRLEAINSRIQSVDPGGGIYTGTLSVNSWTTDTYGVYQDITFSGVIFSNSDLIFTDLNSSNDSVLAVENEAWGLLLEAVPTANTGTVRFKFSEEPEVDIPVRIWVAQKAAVEMAYDGSLLQVLQAVYPVGSIYMSANSVSPATLFGFGMWEQIEDTFLLGAGTTYVGGDTGGEAEHILTNSEAPAHNHSVYIFNANNTNYDAYIANGDGGWNKATNGGRFPNGAIAWQSAAFKTAGSYYSGVGTGDFAGNTSIQGGGQAHNNMPPYLVVYIWKRVA